MNTVHLIDEGLKVNKKVGARSGFPGGDSVAIAKHFGDTKDRVDSLIIFYLNKISSTETEESKKQQKASKHTIDLQKFGELAIQAFRSNNFLEAIHFYSQGLKICDYHQNISPKMYYNRAVARSKIREPDYDKAEHRDKLILEDYDAALIVK